MEQDKEGEKNSPHETEEEGATGDEGDSELEEVTEMDVRDWVRDAMREGLSPRQILLPLLGPQCLPPQDTDEGTLWRLLLSLLMTPEPRNKLSQFNTVDDVVELISGARNIVVLTGAGISVSCGIPDFRSPQGLYATLHREFPELPDPQAMFDIHYFNDDPRPFFKFCKEIYPGQFTPSPSHYFIAALEQRGKLLRHYTQNIDTLEHTAGISRVVYCHGSFATASCCRCKYRVDCDAIREDIMRQEVPICKKCREKEREGEKGGEDSDEEAPGVMKPDIVFFGEGLPDEFHHTLEEDKTKVDLLIVMGSSLKVKPVSLIPSVLDDSVPQILINREPLPHVTFDIQLLGYSDTIVAELCRRLGGEWVESVGVASDRGVHVESDGITSPEEHTHLFPGAVWKSSGGKTTVAGETTASLSEITELNGHTHSLNSEPSVHAVPEASNNTNTSPISAKSIPKMISECNDSTNTLTSEAHPNSDPAPTQTVSCPTTHTPPPSLDNAPPTKRLRMNSNS